MVEIIAEKDDTYADIIEEHHQNLSNDGSTFIEVHKIVHTGYKPFICRTRNKAFARRAEIKDHERTHTGEKPFACDICNMSFTQRSNLTTHKRATHLNDKRYKCEQCDRSFKRTQCHQKFWKKIIQK